MGTTVIANKPLYKHDCEECIYLGSNDIVDFYFCKKTLMYETLVIRLSDKPSDYCSMPVEVAEKGILSGEIRGSVFDDCYHLYKAYNEGKSKTL